MQVFVCIDDKSGMQFNKRRQSKDNAVIDKIEEIVGSQKLWIRSYSRSLFVDNATEDEDMLEKAAKEDFCFVEDVPLSRCVDEMDAIYIFHWNRVYPSDVKLDVDVAKMFHLEYTEEFAGSSHEKITMEKWVR